MHSKGNLIFGLVLFSAFLLAVEGLASSKSKEVVVKPGDDLQQLVDHNSGGTTFHLTTGLYRGLSIIPKDNDVFVGDEGVLLNGAVVLKFEKRGAEWVAAGQTNPDEEEVMRNGMQGRGPGGEVAGQGPNRGGGSGGRNPFGFPGGGGGGFGRRRGGMQGQQGPRGGGGQQGQQKLYRGRCQDEYPLCIFPEDVFVDDLPLVRVQNRNQMSPGKWYSDSSAGEIFLATDPTGHKVEMSVTRSAFSGNANNVTIRGLIIEKYAQPAGEAAIESKQGENWTIEQNETRWNHAVGIKAANGWRILNNKTHHNGDAGMGGSGRDILVEGNEMYKNNYAGYWPGWESGGAKFVLTENLVVRNNYSHDNIGPGLWTDINNKNTLYEGNRTTNNTEGIFHEISFHAVIRNNTIWNDGNNTFGHHEEDAGILIGESRDVEVYGNKITNCKNGILGRQLNRNQDARNYHVDEPYEIRNLYVHDNDITQDSGIALGIVKPAPHVSDDIFSSWGNRFEHNLFHLSDAHGDFFAWQNNRYTEDRWREMMKDR